LVAAVLRATDFVAGDLAAVVRFGAAFLAGAFRATDFLAAPT
jgi:hypothetical protein